MMNRKLDASNRRTASLELQLKTVLANTNVLIDVMRKLANENSAICQMPSGSDDDPTDSTPQGIPEEFQLEDSYLRKTLRERLFPELFGEGQLRFEYNWYGGRKHTKKELDPVRKQIIRRYVCFFFPEFKSEEAWRERIVIKINECLRRNDKRVKKDCVSTSVIIPETDPLCPIDVFNFTD
uniref:BEN domain-containing protein 3 n=1 Tax=Magallana gigas TaxID=29159 RepID=K1Q188_MAGGI